jgi:tripartite-type tricarboxylate transporter receptor subunit TctC
MELFARKVGVHLLHVPYKGASAAASDVVGGRVDLCLVGAAVATQLANAGRVKALAVSSDKRLPALPNVPTFAEAGFPDIDVRGWVGMVAPAQTDPAIVARMQQAVAEALQRPQVRHRLRMLGSSPAPSPSAAFATFLAREEERWSHVVKGAGITFQ